MMLEVLAAIGAVTLAFLAFRFFRGLSSHHAFERVYIDGKPHSLNRLFTEVAKDIGVPSGVTMQLSPIVFAASIELRQKIQTEGMPYKAAIALFLAGSFQALAQKARATGDMNEAHEFQVLVKGSVDYASSFAPGSEL